MNISTNKVPYVSEAKALSIPSPFAFLRERITSASAESHWRSILKAVSYRIFGASITASVTWVVTGKLYVAATIALGETLIKIVAFYFHERVWDNFFARENLKEASQ